MDLSFDKNSIIIKNSSVKTALIDKHNALLYHADTNNERGLNDTGLFIWRRLDGKKSIQDIAVELLDTFDCAPLDARIDDVSKFIDDLLKNDYVQIENIRQSQFTDFIKSPYIYDSPLSMDLAITGKCNLQCKHCFYSDEMVGRDDLPLKQWLSFLKELGQLPVRGLTLTGGEVFTRKDIWQIIDSIIQNRMRYCILTNGTLIDENTLTAFAKGKRKERLDNIQLSIDGSCAEIHDKFRNKGSFEKSIKALKLLQKAKFPVSVRVTINRYNLSDLENITKFLLEELELSSFSTNDAIPIGSGCTNRQSIGLNQYEQRQAMEKLITLSKQFNNRIQATAGPLAKTRLFTKMEKAYTTGEHSTDKQMGFLSACGGVNNKLDILHDGNIVPCHMLHGVVLGKIGTDRIKEIFNNHPTLKQLRKRSEISLSDIKGCKDCKWSPYCNGGCPGLAHEITGDFNLPNTWDCYRDFSTKAGRWIQKD